MALDNKETSGAVRRAIVELNALGVSIKNSGLEEINVQKLLQGLDQRINVLTVYADQQEGLENVAEEAATSKK